MLVTEIRLVQLALALRPRKKALFGTRNPARLPDRAAARSHLAVTGLLRRPPRAQALGMPREQGVVFSFGLLARQLVINLHGTNADKLVPPRKFRFLAPDCPIQRGRNASFRQTKQMASRRTSQLIEIIEGVESTISPIRARPNCGSSHPEPMKRDDARVSGLAGSACGGRTTPLRSLRTRLVLIGVPPANETAAIRRDPSRIGLDVLATRAGILFEPSSRSAKRSQPDQRVPRRSFQGPPSA
jgi:hypothetical protein